MFRRGGHTRTCCSNGSTRAWETAVTTPYRSPLLNVPPMGLTSWRPTRFAVERRRLQPGCKLRLIESLQQEGRLWYLRPQPEARVLRRVYGSVALQHVCQ